MIVIIHSDDVAEDVAKTVRDNLQAEYHDRLDIAIFSECDVLTWPKDPAWDDLIILLFGSAELLEGTKQFLSKEIRFENRERPVLPISCGVRQIPPAPLDCFKALPLDFPRIKRRTGAILGMCLRNRDQTIFISYRASDGTRLAVQLESFLKSKGYQIWRDEARDDYDGEGFIPGGRDVQEVIEERLGKADLILLIDTPQSADSKWIKLEIDLANGLLIPVVPILLRPVGERLIISRFRSLATLQRGCSFEDNGMGLSDSQLESILEEIEGFLAEIFRRKLRVPYLVATEFTGSGYDWNERDNLIYESLKSHKGNLRTRVYSHCSHFEGIFDPALASFVKHLKATMPAANYALYIYDGALISDAQIEDIRFQSRLEDDTSVIILHNQEIAALLHTNFSSLKL
jgi:hypothetical protein